MTRGRLFLRLAVLLVAGTFAYVGWRWYNSVPTAVPPNPKPEELEPAVAAAVSKARESVLKEPKSAKAWGEFGKLLLANELAMEALLCFSEAAKLEPKNQRWEYLQGVILVNDGQREAAIPHFRKAVDLSEKDAKVNLLARLALTETLLYLSLKEEAEPQVHWALERSATDPHVQYDAGLLAMASENWEAARDYFQHCLASPYARKKTRIQLAIVCRRLKDYSRAEDLQKEADGMPADMDWPDTIVDDYMELALKKRNTYKVVENLEAQGRFDEAARRAAIVVENNPNDDVALALLGRLLAQMGEFRAAEEAVRKAIQIAPDKIHPHYLLSLLMIQQGDAFQRKGNKPQAEVAFNAAVSQARKTLEMKPDYGFAHMALGLALKQLGKMAEAEKELREAVRCSPEYAEMHLRLAEVLDALGHRDEACFRYREALRLAAPGMPWRKTVETRLAELRKSGSQTTGVKGCE